MLCVARLLLWSGPFSPLSRYLRCLSRNTQAETINAYLWLEIKTYIIEYADDPILLSRTPLPRRSFIANHDSARQLARRVVRWSP